jgi:hypothetical protein
MNDLIATKFEKMGARLKLNKARGDLQLRVPVRIDVRHHGRGEVF